MKSNATLGSLFSGIGGFEVGFEPAGFKTLWQVERNEYCLSQLAKHWPDAQRHNDVRDVGKHNLAPVDVMVGGFPCQDISHAGKKAGINGEQSGLWYEFARIIGELQPTAVVIENVSTLRNRGLDSVLRSLASLGYDAEWHCVPAYYVGSPQVRNRIWIVAYPMQSGFAGRWASRFRRWGDGQEKIGSSCRGGDTQGDVQCWPEPAVDRVAYGLPQQVLGINAMGNAIVPQMANFWAWAIQECL